MTPLLLTLLTACAAQDGVWLFSLDVDPDAAQECIGSLSHNFVDAAEPDDGTDLDDDPWTGTSATVLSAQTFFGLISTTDSGAVLVVDGETYPGLANEGGGWSFEWTHSRVDDDSDQHASGYGWSAHALTEGTVAFELGFQGDTADGFLVSDTAVEATYTESDAWSQDVADSIGSNGRIPVSSYLVKDDGAGGTYAATNDWTLADCSTNPCTLSVSSACTLSAALSGERTDLDPAAFEAVDGAGQDAGL